MNIIKKEKVFNSCGKLKGSGISLGDDYSKQTLNKCKLLWKSALRAKEECSRVRLNRDRLTVDNNVYVWDYSKIAVSGYGNCRKPNLNHQRLHGEVVTIESIPSSTKQTFDL